MSLDVIEVNKLSNGKYGAKYVTLTGPRATYIEADSKLLDLYWTLKKKGFKYKKKRKKFKRHFNTS